MAKHTLDAMWRAILANRKILKDEHLTVVKIDPKGP